MSKASERFALLALLGFFIFSGRSAVAAGGLPLDVSNFTDPNSLLSDSVKNAVVKAVGLAADHRPYQPATPLGTAIGLDIGVEATILKVPQDFGTSLSSAGLSGTTSPPFLPVARIHLHKGLGSSVNIGGSYLNFMGYSLLGGEFQVTVAQPEEGPAWAIRFCYSTANMGFVSTKTYSPQILMSRQLDFVDPYLGVGYSYATGELTVPVPTGLPEPAPQTVTVTGSGSGGGLLAFVGLPIRPPNLGLKLTLEGSYSSAGAHSIGTKIGFQF